MTRHRQSNPHPHRRVVLSIMGPEGWGKTDIWLTAPQPIVCLNIDQNTAAVAEKRGYAGDDDATIRIHHVPFPLVGFETDEDEVKEQATEAWEGLTDLLRPIIKQELDPMPKTVVLDTGTELNDLNILAEFGRTDKISPQMRQIYMGKVNARFKGIFRGLDHVGCHVIVTHRCREKWETREVRGRGGTEEKDVRVPGEWERIGFKQMGNMCNAEVLALFDPLREGKLASKFGMRIVRSTIRPGIIRKEYWGRERIDDELVRRPSFPYLGIKLYPDTQLSDWR